MIMLFFSLRKSPSPYADKNIIAYDMYTQTLTLKLNCPLFFEYKNRGKIL